MADMRSEELRLSIPLKDAAGLQGEDEDQALDMEPEFRRPKEAVRVIAIAVVALPSLTFAAVFASFAFATGDFVALPWMLTVAAGTLAAAFTAIGLSQNGRPLHVGASFLIISSLCFAAPLGLFLSDRLMVEFWRLNNGATYWNLDPREPGASHRDASIIEFREGSFVDVKHSLGYMKVGSLFCVAPIRADSEAIDVHSQAAAATIVDETANDDASRSHLDSVEYWAVGRDCCDARGAFACGEIRQASRQAVVVDDEDAHASHYRAAVRMAESTYHVSSLSQDKFHSMPRLVQWVSNANEVKESLWLTATRIASTVISLHVALMSGLAVVIYLRLSH